MRSKLKDNSEYLYALTGVFVGAKVAGLIDWSWWVVFAPLWVPVIGLFLYLFVGLLVEAK